MEKTLIKDLWIGKLYQKEEGNYIVKNYNEERIYFMGTKRELAEWAETFADAYKCTTTHVNKSLHGFYKWLYNFAIS